MYLKISIILQKIDRETLINRSSESLTFIDLKVSPRSVQPHLLYEFFARAQRYFPYFTILGLQSSTCFFKNFYCWINSRSFDGKYSKNVYRYNHVIIFVHYFSSCGIGNIIIEAPVIDLLIVFTSCSHITVLQTLKLPFLYLKFLNFI